MRTRRVLVRRFDFFLPHAQTRQLVEHCQEQVGLMTRQCVTSCRFETADELRAQTSEWHNHSNTRQRGVDWQFKVDDARVNLKPVYPQLEV